MQKKLLLAINEGSEGFGFAWFKNEEKKQLLNQITYHHWNEVFFAIGNFRVTRSAAWELVFQGWLFKRSWFGRRGWRLRYREIKQRCFLRCTFTGSGKVLLPVDDGKNTFPNAYPCFLCSRCMITGTHPKGSISSFLGVTLVRTS